MAAHPLVDAAWLASHLDDPDVLVADVRWYLAGKRGVDEWARGHVPGAVFVDLDRDLAGPPSRERGRHPLPSRERFAATLARLGVGARTLVVAYDDAGGAIAARLWWSMRHFGLDGARVLDGGLGAWVAAGGALSTEPRPRAASAPLDLVERTYDVALADEVAALAGDAGALVVDARAVERYAGESEPIDARPGHVPGAASAPFAGNLDPATGRFLPAAALAARWRALGALDAREVVAYCGSGVTACHDLLALALVGRDDARLYPGSWSEWAAAPERPAATGRERGLPRR